MRKYFARNLHAFSCLANSFHIQISYQYFLTPAYIALQPTNKAIYKTMRKQILTAVLGLFTTCAWAQLDITATAAQDTICQGESVQLSVLGDLLDTYSWAPAETLQGAGTANPTATPTVTTTYTVMGMALGQNLIVNGDFSAGNTGFTTAYLHGPETSGGPWGDLSQEGTYAVVADPSSVHTNFLACTDHTSGDGNMLVVNGASVPNTEVWCQTIAVEANTVYQFSSWVNTMVTGSLAQLQFSINGSLLGDNFFAPSVFCEWEQFFELWDSGSNTSADICIVNQNVAVGGNDFGLDDISFVPVLSAESSVTVYVSDVSGQASVDASPDCNGNLGVATAVAEGGFGPYTFLWSNDETTAQAINLEAGTQGVTITDFAGCTTELSVEITAPEDPVIDSLAVGNTSCGLANGTLAVFAGDAGLAPFQYSIAADNFQEANTFENIAAGDYEVVLQDANGCTTTAAFAVAPSDSLLLEIEAPNGTALCLNTDLLLDAGDFAAYEWSTGENTATINPMELGDYAVTVTDEEDCTATATITIGNCGKGWRIPNIFSPNGDGENDLFQPFIEEGAAEIMMFKVYNRWGTLVHDDIAPWDGNYQGKPHPAEVLIYMIQFNTNDGVVNESGQITLAR